MVVTFGIQLNCVWKDIENIFEIKAEYGIVPFMTDCWVGAGTVDCYRRTPSGINLVIEPWKVKPPEKNRVVTGLWSALIIKVRVLDHLEVSRRIYVVPLVLSEKSDIKKVFLVGATELKEELINMWRIVGKKNGSLLAEWSLLGGLGGG